VEFLATSAGQLRSLPLEARGQAAMDIIAQSPFADNPQVMQAVQQAAADGRITDDELTAFEEQMLTYAQKLEGQRWQKSFDQGVTESQRSYDLQAELGRGGLAMERERLDLAKNDAAANPDRKTAEDQNGVLRYLDTGEPVFPNVTTKPEVGKPLIGAEAMARVTAGLPNAKQAVEDLDRLVFRSKGTPLSAEGYDPASDWGAAAVEALPDWGLLKGVARTVGGEDYQLFKDSYGSFEAAMLPIISGAAITESEGLRQMRALEIKPGDSEQTKTRKVAGMRAMVQGVEMAARGDTAGFISMLDRAGSISGAGPVKRGGETGKTGLEDASDDDLFLIMRGQ
jgi:hypothetical protein